MMSIRKNWANPSKGPIIRGLGNAVKVFPGFPVIQPAFEWSGLPISSETKIIRTILRNQQATKLQPSQNRLGCSKGTLSDLEREGVVVSSRWMASTVTIMRVPVQMTWQSGIK
ncbi:MAG: hypothetical protein K1Y36_00205 [Blastocatellia bacterium]|nr:hypothetical protein [Blastocatellia bacterium]